ncbi:SIMPL domain-containing protein [Microbacterium betulae]|uniref:SIMPL domain-containing protein n=1 Tax=Microbacterium betulae TaxID=2981139 RepID=A0AA97I5Q6_9MICO|nr:SIMPL domain-containing protein [Microbacterium sp. AB]WOF21797.1 SIMPL domain-containing protein [Microbacterium sp. AB]
MSDVIITVRGDDEARIAPEQASLHLSVRTEGPARAEVVERTLALAEPVRDGIVAREVSGTVVEWSSKRLAVHAQRSWGKEGRRSAPVFSASVDFTATFADAAELSVWVSEVSSWDGVEIGDVRWILTPGTRASVERDVAARAVGVAVARATAYAEALGLSTVVPLEIADVGLLSRGDGGSPIVPKTARAAAFSVNGSDSSPAMDYQPDDIVVSATVEARFTAR